MRSDAVDDLFPLVYEHLRALASKHQAAGRCPTVNPTDLVHETYLKLARSEAGWRDRAHFLAVAATAMRHVVVDRARGRKAEKRGGGWEQVTLTGLGATPPLVDLLTLEKILVELETLDPDQARLVQLRVFGGMTDPEIAEVLGVTDRTVRTRWRRARAWMMARLNAG